MFTAILKYTWFFFIYAFLGWCTEVIFAACVRGVFENRGFFNGPICPIYGFGVVAVVLLLEPLKDNFWILFIGSVIVTSVLELITGYLMEKIFKHRWWDYSKMPLNIGGYVCLAFSLIWGFACVFLIDIIHPSIAFFVNHIPNLVTYIALPIFVVTFFTDLIATSASVFHFNKKLEEIDKKAAQIRQISDEIGRKLSDKAIEVKENEKTKKLVESVMESKTDAQTRLETLKISLDEKERELSLIQRRLIKAFPTMRSTKHAEAFAKIKEKLASKTSKASKKN
jgi:uncharacterized membrane protein